MLTAGCAGTRLPASVSGGIDQVFPAPPHEIRGLTRADQAWIDETIAAGASCCGWVVKPRPQSLDRKIAVSPLVAAPPPKKRRWWQRKAPAV
jgi:hypothetical protein